MTARTPDEIRHDIEETRDELADTAAALAYKADVKARAKERVDEVKADVKHRATDKAHAVESTVKQHPIPTAAIVAAVLGLALGFAIARRSD
jgi:ElaB/YqjD/DUF883 family membrane-anchored ribosome-binding protein